MERVLYAVVLCQRHGRVYHNSPETRREPGASLETWSAPFNRGTPCLGLHGNTITGLGQDAVDRAAGQWHLPVPRQKTDDVIDVAAHGHVFGAHDGSIE